MSMQLKHNIQMSILTAPFLKNEDDFDFVNVKCTYYLKNLSDMEGRKVEKSFPEMGTGDSRL
jgi:hypothetical protein